MGAEGTLDATQGGTPESAFEGTLEGTLDATLDATLETGLTHDQARALLERYNSDPYHLRHAETLEALMRHFAAAYDPANVDFWGQVGLLHDLDWEAFPDQHTVRAAEILAEAGATPELTHAIRTHIFSHDPTAPKPEAKMERMLFAMDELSGLIAAAILVRPSKSVADMGLKSLKKKFKQRSFAAGCSRDDIALGAELNDLTTDELLALGLEAMKAVHDAGGPVDSRRAARAGGAPGSRPPGRCPHARPSGSRPPARHPVARPATEGEVVATRI